MKQTADSSYFKSMFILTTLNKIQETKILNRSIESFE